MIEINKFFLKQKGIDIKNIKTKQEAFQIIKSIKEKDD